MSKLQVIVNDVKEQNQQLAHSNQILQNQLQQIQAEKDQEIAAAREKVQLIYSFITVF